MNRSLVSIVVRTFNRPKRLRKALASLAAQSYRPLEAVVVNDAGCPLDPAEMSGTLADVALVYVELPEHGGRAAAGNAGIAQCRGRYIGFLDDDDELFPDHVQVLANYLDQSDLKVAYSDSVMVYQQYDPEVGQLVETDRSHLFSEDFNYDKLLFDNYIPLICLLFDREVLRNAGGFDPEFDLYEDHDLLLRIGETCPFHHIPKVTAAYYQWCAAHQIAQASPDHVIRDAHIRLLEKHLGKFSGPRIYHYRKSMTLLKDRCIQTLQENLAETETRIHELRDRIDQLGAATRETDAAIAGWEEFARVKEAQVSELTAQIHQLGVSLEREKDWNRQALQDILAMLHQLDDRKDRRKALIVFLDRVYGAGTRMLDTLKNRSDRDLGSE